MDPTSGELVHLMHKKMQTNNKKAKSSIPWRLLSIIANLKVKENAELDLDARLNSDFNESELQPTASKHPPPPDPGKNCRENRKYC